MATGCSECQRLSKEVDHLDKAFKQLMAHTLQLEKYGQRLRARVRARPWDSFDRRAAEIAASRGLHVIQGGA